MARTLQRDPDNLDFLSCKSERYGSVRAGGIPLLEKQRQTAEVAGGKVTFRLEDGRMLDLETDDPLLRHIDRAWASTVHAFRGRTVDTVIAAMEANHPNLTTQKTLYVEISRANVHGELVTDDKAALREQLEAVTSECIAVLKAVDLERAKGRKAELEPRRNAGQEGGAWKPLGAGSCLPGWCRLQSRGSLQIGRDVLEGGLRKTAARLAWHSQDSDTGGTKGTGARATLHRIEWARRTTRRQKACPSPCSWNPFRQTV